NMDRCLKPQGQGPKAAIVNNQTSDGRGRHFVRGVDTAGGQGGGTPRGGAAMRLRWLLLVAFALTAAVPLLLFWLWPHARLLSYELDAVRERHLPVAGTLAATLDSYHRQVVATFALVQERLGDADVAEDAGALLQALHFRNICLYDAGSGRLGGRVDSFDSRCDEQLDAATLTTFRALAAAPAGSISPVTAGPGGAPTLYLAAERGPLLAV